MEPWLVLHRLMVLRHVRDQKKNQICLDNHHHRDGQLCFVPLAAYHGPLHMRRHRIDFHFHFHHHHSLTSFPWGGGRRAFSFSFSFPQSTNKLYGALQRCEGRRSFPSICFVRVHIVLGRKQWARHLLREGQPASGSLCLVACCAVQLGANP